jgi:DNA-3-methyladenine glycosylase
VASEPCRLGIRAIERDESRSGQGLEMLTLTRDFYGRDTVRVAKELLGTYLVRVKGKSRMVGRIVEVEAYRGSDDPASHAFRGLTLRNEPMFGEPGHAYIYFTYGNHYCLNVTTQKSGTPGAVLVRALEPLQGFVTMRRLRPKVSDIELTNGPGKLTKAFGIDKSLNKVDLTQPGPLFISPRSGEPLKIVRSARVGIREGTDRLWRLYIAGCRYVSKHRREKLGFQST